MGEAIKEFAMRKDTFSEHTAQGWGKRRRTHIPKWLWRAKSESKGMLKKKKKQSAIQKRFPIENAFTGRLTQG